MGIPDHLTCLLRNLCSSKGKNRTRHGTTDWFQIGKGVRESIPRQIDKKFRVPKEEKGVGGSRSGDWGSGILKEEKRTNFLSLYIPQSQSITQLSLNSVLGIIQQQCTAGGQFLLPENLLTNPDILEYILWEWVWEIFLLLNSNLVILKCKLWE